MSGLCFVVFASAKSGTTWVQRMLCGHPVLHCGESRPFGLYYDPSSPSAPHMTAEQYARFVSRHLHAPGDQGELSRRLGFAVTGAVMRVCAEAAGKAVYGEKLTPYPGTGREVVERLREYAPDVRFVHLVRDGRDVVVSGAVHQMNLRIARGMDAERYREALASGRVPGDLFGYLLDIWSDSAAAGIAGMERFEHAMELRYERLLGDAHGEMARLLGFLGVADDAETVARCVETCSFERISGGRSAGDEDRTSFFRKGVAGDWRNWLTAEQERTVRECANGLLGRLGYTGARAA